MLEMSLDVGPIMYEEDLRRRADGRLHERHSATLVLLPLFRLEQAISDAGGTIVDEVTMVLGTPGELIEVDRGQERLDWMRAEFRAAQQRRYERVAIPLATTTALAKPEPGPPPQPTLPTPV